MAHTGRSKISTSQGRPLVVASEFREKDRSACRSCIHRVRSCAVSGTDTPENTKSASPGQRVQSSTGRHWQRSGPLPNTPVAPESRDQNDSPSGHLSPCVANGDASTYCCGSGLVAHYVGGIDPNQQARPIIPPRQHIPGRIVQRGTNILEPARAVRRVVAERKHSSGSPGAGWQRMNSSMVWVAGQGPAGLVSCRPRSSWKYVGRRARGRRAC